MQEKVMSFLNVNLTFERYEGTIKGFNKFLESTTVVRGGGGHVRTGISGKVSRYYRPVMSRTKHSYISEFFLVEEDGKEVPLELQDIDGLFRDEQIIALWVEKHNQLIYRIYNKNTQRYTSIVSLKRILNYDRFYFRQLIHRNLFPGFIWYLVVCVSCILAIAVLRDLIRSRFDVAAFLTLLFTCAVLYLIQLLTRRVMLGFLYNGFRRKLKKMFRNESFSYI